MNAPARVTLREARTESATVAKVGRLGGVSDVDAVALFNSTAQRLREMLRLQANPFDIAVGGSMRVDGVAGLIRLTPAIELQVVPKFLDPADPSWQEDFFLLALFSQTGRILPRDQIRAGTARRGDLASLVAQTFTRMFREHQRRPIRTYAHRHIREFALDGDVDPLEVVLPDPDGFEQAVLELQRDNEYNAVMAGAVTALLPEVRDAETRKQLLRMQQALAPQPSVRSATPRRLPSRDRQWQPAYDLAVQVLNGFGLGYAPEHMLAPGFVLRTWITWQALVETALRTGMPSATVHGQQQFYLGDRSAQPLNVTPDVVISVSNTPRLVVDAKYRTREGMTPTMEAGDVYESLAFMEATGTRAAVLLYPRPASDGSALPIGTANAFETVTVGTRVVVGLTVEVRGISSLDGYGQFAKRLSASVSAYLPHLGSP